TYTPEGQELLAKFMQFKEKPYYMRAHHLLCTGNCHGFYKWGSTNAYMEDSAGKATPPSTRRILDSVKLGYEVLSRYPPFSHLECILPEIDPDGWAAGGQYDNPNLNFRNTEYYPSFVACAFDQVSKF